jgi:hypothetical protein
MRLRYTPSLALSVLVLGAMQAVAQNDTSVFAPLALPSPTAVRTASGAPGARYWQNRADYAIEATLDTATKTLKGTLRLRYTNHSPDTLRFLWLHVEQNAFTSTSLMAARLPDTPVSTTLTTAMDSAMGMSMAAMMGFDMGPGAAVGGDHIDRFEQIGPGARPVPLHTRIEGTELKADLAAPLAPGATVLCEVTWHFTVPVQGGPRMGRDGSLYEMAQWYPRVAVYDDVSGWNTEPYDGPGEFYLEYGDFTYAITLPATYIVAGTGTLDNPDDVLTASERARLAQARVSAQPVAIVSAADLTAGTARPRTTGTLTWRFHAHNVRDVAWTAAPNYQWDAVGWHGILAQAYFRPAAASVWKDAADMARTSIEEYSRWYPYPYPQITAVEGPVGGMEYPMLAMESATTDKYALYNVITHEVGHNWFPMVVGSNERQYAWQDEGFNTFLNTFAEARRFPEKGDQVARIGVNRAQVEAAQAHASDLTIMRSPNRTDMDGLGYAAYAKPSVGLQMLREDILGPEAFDDALRTYIQRWAYRHPTPADFFRTMEDVSGHRLDWFWREFWLESDRFDQSIDSVAIAHRPDGDAATIVYGNHARGVLPILVRFSFADGTTKDMRYPAEAWTLDPRRYARHYMFTGQRLARVEIDPDHRLVDVDRTNNVWSAAPTT